LSFFFRHSVDAVWWTHFIGES